MLSIVDKFATCASLWKLTIVWTQNIGTNNTWTSHLTHPRWTNTHNCTESLFWIKHFKDHIKPKKQYYCKVSIINYECTQWMICLELLCCAFMLWWAQGNVIDFVFYIKSCHDELIMEWRGWCGCLNCHGFRTCAIYFMLIQAITLKSRCLHVANVFNWCIVIVSEKLSFYTTRSRGNSNGHKCGRNAWQLNINVCLVKDLLPI